MLDIELGGNPSYKCLPQESSDLLVYRGLKSILESGLVDAILVFTN
jgi:hypothetical protein